jgi:hypothetical protein
MTRYLLCPGYVTSRHDGDDHYIDAPTLARLYRVPLDECLVGDRRMAHPGLVVLAPRFDGDYSIPKPQPHP